jgi:hypothetical protein
MRRFRNTQTETQTPLWGRIRTGDLPGNQVTKPAPRVLRPAGQSSWLIHIFLGRLCALTESSPSTSGTCTTSSQVAMSLQQTARVAQRFRRCWTPLADLRSIFGLPRTLAPSLPGGDAASAPSQRIDRGLDGRPRLGAAVSGRECCCVVVPRRECTHQGMQAWRRALSPAAAALLRPHAWHAAGCWHFTAHS